MRRHLFVLQVMKSCRKLCMPCRKASCGTTSDCAAGHEKLQEVVHAVFAYISMLKSPGGVTQDRFEENRALSDLRFRFADKNSPYNYVEKLSSAMQSYEDR